jgi:hypothetical protein
MTNKKKRYLAYAAVVIFVLLLTVWLNYQEEWKEWRFERWSARITHNEYAHFRFGHEFPQTFMMYAMDDPLGRFPPLAPIKDIWMFDVSLVYPDYMSHLSILVARDHPDKEKLLAELQEIEKSDNIDWDRVARLAAQSFVYTGWATTGSQEMPEMAKGRFEMSPDKYHDDIQIPGTDKVFHRLQEGVERYMITDLNNPGAAAMALSDVLVIFETLQVAKNNKDGGGNSTFKDGHFQLLSIPDLKKTFNALYPDGVPGLE